MSAQPTNPNPDLNRLMSDGYEIELKHGHLIVHGVPYVTKDREVRRGKLVSELTLAGDRTTRPSTHVVMFAGTYPCDRFGPNRLEAVRSDKFWNICEQGLSSEGFSLKFFA